MSASSAPTPRRIAADRYRSRHFHELERARLWTRVWQLACTEDCIAQPGDYYEYRCGALSILILRDETGALRAFQNACRHRGAALVDGAGGGLTQLRCRYHGWCYDLRGHLRKVSDDGMGAGHPGPLSLAPVQVASWEGLVFVNPDPSAEPLDEFLEVLPKELAWMKLGEYSCQYVFSVPLRCNWKVVVDAFIETYHLHVVHPQMLAIADDVNTPIRLYDKHTMFEQPYGVPSPRLARPDDATLWQEFARNLGHRFGRPFASDESLPPPPEVPPGQTMKQVLTRMIREYLRSAGDLYPSISDDQAIHDYHYHVFPNAVFNLFAGWYGFIRARPGPAPDQCWLDMWNFDLLPPGHPKRHARPVEQILQPHEVGPLGLVVKQDVDNFEALQRGLEQPGTRELRLVPAEARIGRMHEILDRYLGTDCRAELSPETGAAQLPFSPGRFPAG